MEKKTVQQILNAGYLWSSAVGNYDKKFIHAAQQGSFAEHTRVGVEEIDRLVDVRVPDILKESGH